MEEINLWNIYYMTTNSKTDVWTQRDFLSHKISITKINQPKYRLTIPIQKIRTLNSRKKIYLVCQISSSFNEKSIKIPNSLKWTNSQIHGFILPINIRMATENEFIKTGKQIFVNKKERTKFYKNVWNKLHNDPWLKWRLQKIKEIMNGNYDSSNQVEVFNLIKYFQFDKTELKQKGYR